MIQQVTDRERALSRQIDEQGGQTEHWRDRAVKAEARVAELEAALLTVTDVLDEMGNKSDTQICPAVWTSLNAETSIRTARAALKGTP